MLFALGKSHAGFTQDKVKKWFIVAIIWIIFVSLTLVGHPEPEAVKYVSMLHYQCKAQSKMFQKDSHWCFLPPELLIPIFLKL